MLRIIRFNWLLFLMVLAVMAPASLRGQVRMSYPVRLQWNGVVEQRFASDTLLYMDLESGVYEGLMPVYYQSYPIYDDAVKVEVELLNVKAETLSGEELQVAHNFTYTADFEVTVSPLRSRDEALLSVRIVPFRQKGGQYEKLLSAMLSVTLTPDFTAQRSNPTYVHRSAMASGSWYKIGLAETGIYKLTASDLTELGIDVSKVDPRQIRIYHNGGGVLPEMNAASRPDDLVEVPIYVSGESDGRFDNNDYILFYGRGPVCWKLESNRVAYTHEQNAYDDYAYAFVVLGLGQGKRIGEASQPSGNAGVIINQFLDHQVYENDQYNVFRVGRTFYGDKMDYTSTKNIDFNFPNVVTTMSCWVKTALMGRNFQPANFEVFVDNVNKATYSIQTTTSSTERPFGYDVGGWVTANPSKDNLSVMLKHNAFGSTTTSEGYVDYVLANAWRKLTFTGGQMLFRNPEASVSAQTYEYRLANVSQQTQVWDVSDPCTPAKVKGQLNGSTFSFKVAGNRDNEYVAYDGSSYCSAKAFGKVDNQNLHGVRDVDFVILTYADFMEQAERLKAIHNRIDPDLNVYITTPELIYNEFSCGAKDVTAIRDFCRMLYLDSSPGRKIKYLLLLGDCSYDYKNRDDIVDFVPSFESVKSIYMNETYVTDDYYGFMDENEGDIVNSLADIGIGRFPVQTLEQATQMVDKIERYIVKDATTMQPWRNAVTFFTDDEAGFVRNAESLADMLKNVGGDGVVIDKIYLDAYPQISAPGGEIAPEVNAAINSRMEKGTLVLNYVGHGGEVQLSEEKILQRKDVDSWRNAPMYPLMITGTCEFSRYDDHQRTSLGEYSFLNQYGGMIAMFTTSRVTIGPDNLNFAIGVYNNLFRIVGGEHYRLGDVYRMAKTNGGTHEKRYVFFGDPALRLTYPKWKVETLSINGQYPGYDMDSIPINDSTWQTYPIYHDTIGALQPVEIVGVVKDLDGNVASNFNGVVSVIVYDKEAELSTNGTACDPIAFKLRNSMIFNGKAEAVNGKFKINFIVPRDISYRYGQGLINYYATDYDIDANGNCDSFIIGGFYDEATEDNEEPEIKLFIDDTLFVNGGLTGQNPMLLAFVNDESGINTTGAGIGHDIMATLTGPTKNAYCLNDYFVAELDQPGKGSITYKMQDLADGDYTLTLKVWDIYNNSSTASIDFTVVNNTGMVIENVFNAPNPVTDETHFVFDHNQVGNNVKVDIYIYDIIGRWVNTISETVSGASTRVDPIRWDGRGAGGANLRNGVYVYRIVATNDYGETATLVSKLVLSK
ncbi:MAG: type IX secretion system sortase PorU [Bacteroidales bacterium]|nr:type IX secretion system sortase PorU [Bacteroidales bacterium]